MAIKLFDKFVAMNRLVPDEMQPLIAMTCLGLACKMHENCILDFEQCIQLCYDKYGYSYQIEMFIQAEFQIFKQFDFDIILPTAVDLMLQVLFLECDGNSN